MKIYRTKRYPQVDGKAAIEIEIENILQIFDGRDPAPFRYKDLDDDAVDYIVTSMIENSVYQVEKLLVFVGSYDEIPTKTSKEDVIKAIHQHFAYEAELTRKKINNILRQGFKALLIGISFLSLAILASKWVSLIEIEFFSSFLKEGLLLLGWVSMWRPINVFLYEWWPYADLKKIYLKLSEIEVEILPSKPLHTYLSEAK